MSSNEDLPASEASVTEDVDETLALQSIKLHKANTLLKAKKYEDAAEILSNILAKRTAAFGELSDAVADIALDYGICLLRSYQQQNYANTFGPREISKTAAEAAGGVIVSGATDPVLNTEENEEGEEGEEEEEEKATPEEDLETAWGSFEMARVIYSNKLQKGTYSEREEQHIRKLLAETCINLGEVSCESNNFAQAVEDYTKALQYVPENDLSFQSEIYVQLAMAYINREDQNLPEALKYYKMAADVHAKVAEKHAFNAKDAKEVLEEIKLRVTELEEAVTAKEAPPAATVKETLAEITQTQPVISTGPSTSENVQVLVPRKKVQINEQANTKAPQEAGKRKREDEESSTSEPESKKQRI